MSYIVAYHEQVVKEDIPALDKVVQERIKSAIEAKLLTEPEKFGKPLRKTLKGYRKLRVGDYRIIFEIQKKKVIIYAIKHRSIVYKNT